MSTITWIRALRDYWRRQKRTRRRRVSLRDQYRYLREFVDVVDKMTAAGVQDRIIMHPRLTERTPTTPFDPHYFYQNIWAFRRIYNRKPELHIDIGSQVILVGLLSCVVPVEFVDIRPLPVDLPDFTPKKGTLLDLPYDNHSLDSVSCLHVAEHVGLGRYGDPLDVFEGTRLACAELQRVLRPGGHLYFSLPIARANRLEFNAHRVHTVDGILSYFPELRLVEFSGITDKAEYIEHIQPEVMAQQEYGCGLFLFTRD